ncbi:MAG TPA: Rieske 2Fe-2S domain-containing protein [Ktedonobacteraceae bacterium]
MAGEDQERFEDYLELERFIEDLQAGRASRPPEGLTPDQARIYRMATLFHTASVEEDAPRPEFVAGLQAKLEQVEEEAAKGIPASKARPFFSRKPQTQPRVSRRALLTGGAAAAVAAASLSVGVGISHAVDNPEIASLKTQLAQATSWPDEKFIAEGANTVLRPVTTLDKLGEQPVSFNLGGIVGYIIRNDDDSGEPANEPVIAVSAACTHMGCIVQWQGADKKFHCPCHDGIFSEYGKPDPHSPVVYKSLPRLEVQIDPDGTIKVRVPNIPASATTAL